jgi:hypothetical protein
MPPPWTLLVGLCALLAVVALYFTLVRKPAEPGEPNKQ